jgi:hypothetical protein
LYKKLKVGGNLKFEARFNYHSFTESFFHELKVTSDLMISIQKQAMMDGRLNWLEDLGNRQGDRIGRFFAHWVSAYFVRFIKNQKLQ